MAQAIIQDRKTVMSCCSWCDSQYNIGGAFVGVPAVLGAKGLEKVLELDLNDKEKDELKTSVDHVKQLVNPHPLLTGLGQRVYYPLAHTGAQRIHRFRFIQGSGEHPVGNVDDDRFSHSDPLPEQTFEFIRFGSSRERRSGTTPANKTRE